MISPGRALAFEILAEVEDGGFASELLVARSGSLDSRDAGLAHELVFGVLRFEAQLDYLIEHFSGRRQRLDVEVRLALRLAIYQLRYLERIPAHAAVTESVELVKRARKRSAAGFVNAVLRKVNRNEVAWPSRQIALSCPEWLIARWESQFGREKAEAIAAAALHAPETWVRYAGTPTPELEPVEDVAGAYLVRSGAAPEGARIQDIGSQSIVPLLELSAGQSFLDLCAAPGNKTAHALEFGVDAVACDLHPKRLAHVAGCRRVALDASQPLPFARRFDRILVDAPCSGTGTLGRNPEIKWRLSRAKIKELNELQRRILAGALEHLAPGGRLVYSTCSLENEENQDVVAAVVREAGPRFRVLETAQRTPGTDPGDGFFAAVLA